MLAKGRGASTSSASTGGISQVRSALRTPRERLATYLFNRRHIQHHFCPTCGIAPFGEGQAPDGSTMVAVNVRCLPEVELDALQVAPFDGARL